MTEAAVLAKIRKFLEGEGWLVQRQQSGMFVGWGQIAGLVRLVTARRHGAAITAINGLHPTRVGYDGQPDLIAFRRSATMIDEDECRRADVLAVEVKAPGKRPRADQLAALADLRQAGVTAVWADGMNDLEGSHPFGPWYRSKYPCSSSQPSLFTSRPIGSRRRSRASTSARSAES